MSLDSALHCRKCQVSSEEGNFSIQPSMDPRYLDRCIGGAIPEGSWRICILERKELSAVY